MSGVQRSPEGVEQGKEEISAAIADPGASLVLQVGDEHTTLSLRGGESAAPLVINLGWRSVAARNFKQQNDSLTAVALEAAIMTVEDALAPARSRIAPASTLITHDSAVREIATVAGVSGNGELTLSRDAVEQMFQRLAATAMGRPASAGGLPPGAQLAGTLLILREFMHHMDFAEIRIDPAA